jgi:hypothetical protein
MEDVRSELLCSTATEVREMGNMEKSQEKSGRVQGRSQLAPSAPAPVNVSSFLPAAELHRLQLLAQKLKVDL